VDGSSEEAETESKAVQRSGEIGIARRVVRGIDDGEHDITDYRR
jgi:hypothetical protein